MESKEQNPAVLTQLEQYLEQEKEDLRALTEELRNQDMPPLTEELFALYEKNGNRLEYERVYFRRREFLAVFGIAAILWRRKEDIRKLEEVVLSVCRETCWALPAHVNRAENPDWAVTVDLFASETAEAFAEICHGLRTYLDLSLLARMKEEVCRRVLFPVMAKEPYAWWETCTINWNAVCCGSVGIAALVLMGGDPKGKALALRMAKAQKSGYLAGFGADGACTEGLGYWNYGFSYFAAFADVCEQEGLPCDLFDGEKPEKIAQFQQACFFAGGRTVSFSDGDRRGRWRAGLTSWLADRYNRGGKTEILFPDFSYCLRPGEDECWRFSQMYRDIVWTERLCSDLRKGICSAGLLTDADQVTILPEAQWVICRRSQGFSWAAKGGNNDEPHNHNDVGSFFLLYGDTEVLCDLGSGEYTKAYFSDGRYDIFCNNSESHNVPLVRGALQKEGSAHRCTEFAPEAAGTVRMRFDRAYETLPTNVLVRRIDGSLPESFAVEDSLQTADATAGNPCAGSGTQSGEPALLTENFVTQLSAEIREGAVVLTAADGQAFRMTLPAGCGPVELLHRAHSNHAGEMEDVTLIRFAAPAAGSAASCRVTICPV